MARHGRRGWRLDKVAKADYIDAIGALAMALDRAEHRVEPARLLGWV